MIKFRVDDFPGTKPDEFDHHNIANFHIFNSVMRSFGIKYTLGVIPKYTTYYDLKYFNDNMDNINVALHGINHDEKFMNEFMPFYTVKDIAMMLQEASQSMSKFCTIDSYIPPHNEIDSRTCNALKSIGILKVFGGPGTNLDVVAYARSIGLEFNMSEFPLCYGRTDEMIMTKSVTFLSENCKDNDVYVTLHWPWEYNIGFDHMKRYLDILTNECAKKGCRIDHG